MRRLSLTRIGSRVAIVAAFVASGSCARKDSPRVDGASPVPPPTPVRVAADSVGYEVAPILLSVPDVDYPTAAREKGIEGIVLVRVLVGVRGRVEKLMVIQSVPGLDSSAEKAASAALFEPATLDGRPVAVWMVIPIEYRIHTK